MKNGLKTLGAATLIAASLIGCSKEEAKKAAEQIDQKAEQLSINDQWASTCRNERFDVFGVASATERYDFGESATRVTTLYASDNCVDPVVEVTEIGKYELGATVSGDTRSLDISLESVKVKPLVANAANFLNQVKACDHSDWKTNNQIDVTAKSSDDAILSRCWAKTPRTIHDIAAVKGTELRLGLKSAELDKSTPEKRPTELDSGVVYKRQ